MQKGPATTKFLTQDGFTPIIVIVGVVLVLALLIFGILYISGVYTGNNFLDGMVINKDTKAPIPSVKVAVSNRGWGFTNGRLVWDKDYEYSSNTDQQGKFYITYNIGPSAHVVLSQDGYERFDEYFDRNSKVIIELTKLPPKPTDKREDWETYQKEVIFQYPGTWVKQKEQILATRSDQLFVSPDGNYTLYFIVEQNLNGLTKKPFSALDEIPTNLPDLKDFISVTLDSQPAGRVHSYQFDNLGDGGWTNKVFMFSKDKKSIYQLLLFTSNKITKTGKEGEQIFDQILSTFKFLNRGQVKQTSVCPSMEPRRLGVKQKNTKIRSGQVKNRFNVRFTEGTGIRLRDGKLISINGHDLAELDKILNKYKVEIERLYNSQSEEELDKKRLELETKSCKQLADLNLAYVFKVPEQQDNERFINELNELSVVEVANPISIVVNS